MAGIAMDVASLEDREWLSALAPPVLQTSPLRDLENSLKHKAVPGRCRAVSGKSGPRDIQ